MATCGGFCFWRGAFRARAIQCAEPIWMICISGRCPAGGPLPSASPPRSDLKMLHRSIFPASPSVLTHAKDRIPLHHITKQITRCMATCGGFCFWRGALRVRAIQCAEPIWMSCISGRCPAGGPLPSASPPRSDLKMLHRSIFPASPSVLTHAKDRISLHHITKQTTRCMATCGGFCFWRGAFRARAIQCAESLWMSCISGRCPAGGPLPSASPPRPDLKMLHRSISPASRSVLTLHRSSDQTLPQGSIPPVTWQCWGLGLARQSAACGEPAPGSPLALRGQEALLETRTCRFSTWT